MGDSQTVAGLCSGGSIGLVQSMKEGVLTVRSCAAQSGDCHNCPIRHSQLAGAGASEYDTLQAGEVAI